MTSSISNFMAQKFGDIEAIVFELEKEFNSHDFIKRFAKRFEPEYVEFLNNYKERHFQTVHRQIALFLSNNADELKIRKTKIVKSETIFGEFDEIQGWEKF